jgi:hypothetical protein
MLGTGIIATYLKMRQPDRIVVSVQKNGRIDANITATKRRLTIRSSASVFQSFADKK